METRFLEHSLFILSLAERQTNTAPANIERTPSSESVQLPAYKALIKPEDLEPVEPGSSLKTLRTLRRHRAVPDHFMTSSSLIGAVSDGPFTSSKSEVEMCGDKYVVHTLYHTVPHV